MQKLRFPFTSYIFQAGIRPAWKSLRWKLAILFPTIVLSQIFTVLIPISLGKYFEIALDYTPYRSQLLNYLPSNWTDSIPHFFIFFGIVVLLKTLLDVCSRYYRDTVGLEVSRHLQRELFDKQVAMPVSEFGERGIGRYLLRWSGDLTSIQNWISKGIIQSMIDFILMSFCIGILISWFPQLTWDILLSWLVCWVILGLHGKFLYKRSTEKRNSRSVLLSHVSQRLRGIEQIQTFNREVPEKKRFQKLLNKSISKHQRYLGIRAYVWAIAPLLFYLWLGYFLYRMYALPIDSPTQVIPAVLLLISLAPVCRRMFRVVIYWKDGLISLRKLERILDMGPSPQPVHTKFSYLKGSLTIRNLSFSYPNELKVFSRLNLQIEGAGIYRVTLAPGEGKSTLVRLLTGMIPCKPGMIYWDDQDIQSISGASLRKHISVVSDIHPLLGKTVFEAISYSRKRAKRKAAANMLDALQAYLSQDKRLTLDTRIGEMGMKLCASQQKMLRYCRAFLTRKPILLIEKPWQDVCTQQQEIIWHKLEEMQTSRTIILLDAYADVATVLGEEYKITKPIHQPFSATTLFR